jgi:hypothetical protein
MGVIAFDKQFEIEPVGSKPFSLGGDSGSLIVDSRRRLRIGHAFAVVLMQNGCPTVLGQLFYTG